MHFFSKSFLVKFLLSGKWLNFYQTKMLSKGVLILDHVQSKFQAWVSSTPCGNSFH